MDVHTEKGSKEIPINLTILQKCDDNNNVSEGVNNKYVVIELVSDSKVSVIICENIQIFFQRCRKTKHKVYSS